jgi:hypothetical protein
MHIALSPLPIKSLGLCWWSEDSLSTRCVGLLDDSPRLFSRTSARATETQQKAGINTPCLRYRSDQRVLDYHR